MSIEILKQFSFAHLRMIPPPPKKNKNKSGQKTSHVVIETHKGHNCYPCQLCLPRTIKLGVSTYCNIQDVQYYYVKKDMHYIVGIHFIDFRFPYMIIKQVFVKYKITGYKLKTLVRYFS